jgi:hypothetical protein
VVLDLRSPRTAIQLSVEPYDSSESPKQWTVLAAIPTDWYDGQQRQSSWIRICSVAVLKSVEIDLITALKPRALLVNEN